MKLVSAREQSESSRKSAVEPLNVVVAYDTEYAANVARRQVFALIAQSIPEVDLHREEWSFEDLAHPRCGQEAIELAAECDLFILATVQSADLSPSVFTWLNDWLEGRSRKETALVCLVASEDGSELSSPVHRSLHWLARSHGLAFFAGGFVLPKSVPSYPTENRLHDCSGWQRWGINE